MASSVPSGVSKAAAQIKANDVRTIIIKTSGDTPCDLGYAIKVQVKQACFVANVYSAGGSFAEAEIKIRLNSRFKNKFKKIKNDILIKIPEYLNIGDLNDYTHYYSQTEIQIHLYYEFQ